MSSSYFVLSTWVAVALQCLRLSLDLIQVAATGPNQEYGENTKPAGAQEQATDVTVCTTPNSQQRDTATMTSLKISTSTNTIYGSIKAEDEEAQPLKTSVTPTKQQEESTTTSSSSSSSSRCCSWTHRQGWIWQIQCFGAVVLLITLACTGDSHDTTTTSWTVRPFLGWAALWIFLEAWLSYRDVSRSRYGWFSRILRWITAVALAVSATTSGIAGGAVPAGVTIRSVLIVVFVTTIWDDGYSMRLHRQHHLNSIATNINENRDRNPKTVSRHTMLILLKPYFWPDATNNTAFWNRVRAISTWLFLIASKGCNLTAPLMVGHASTALAHQAYRESLRYSIYYATLLFFGVLFNEAKSVVYLKVAQAAFVQLSEAAFDHLHHLSLDWHLRKRLGEVLRGMDRGIAACDQIMNYLFMWLVPAFGECLVVTIIFATYFQYLPLALSVFSFVFVYIVWTILVTLWRKKFRKALVMSDNEWHDRFTDSMVNFETVKYFTAEKHEKEQFGESVSKYQSGSVNVQASLSFLNISQQILLQACMATALSTTVWAIQQRMNCCSETAGCDVGLSDCCRKVDRNVCPGMQVGDFVAVLSYVVGLFAPLNFLGSMYNAVIMAMIDLTSLSELLAETPDVTDALDAIELPSDEKVISDKEGVAVEFDNVYFRYPTQPESKGIKGLSFKMKRGTTTAIVGATGEGKTTISRLLFRFYDVHGGAVKVNGVDVRSVTQKSLRDAIGVVPQSASMFNTTIRENLRYGKQDATDDELRQSAKDAQLLDFIESMDDGWDTLVGDRGLKLSGGEKQRAAIARCLLKNPPFVILDEATASLDTLTEKSVQDALDRLGKQRTVLVIAHRLGTIRNADNIVVLKDGKVTEEGTHEHLLAKNGVYAAMWNMQLRSTTSSSMKD